MKQIYILIFAFLFLSTFKAEGQGRVHWTDFDKIIRWTDFDTIKVYPDRIYVDYKTYSDSTLTEEGQVFLYPGIRKIRKSMLLPSFIQVKVPADSMVLHGKVTVKLNDGKYRIGKYDNGQKIEMKYFDHKGEEITHKEFYPGICFDCDPEKGYNRFFYHGTKKQKEKIKPLPNKT